MAASDQKFDKKALPITDVPAMRAGMQKMVAVGLKMLGPLSSALEEFWTTITLPDGWESKVLVIRPKGVSSGDGQKHPLIVLFFGGGFIAGTPDQLTRPARNYAEKFGAVVLSCEYRLVPDVRWPVPYRDGYDILAHLADHAESEFGASLDSPGGGFVVGGVSAGASIAAVAGGIHMFGVGDTSVTRLSKPLTGLSLCMASLATREIIPEEYQAIWTSREDNKDVEGLNSAAVEYLLQELQADIYSPWFSPFNTIKNVQEVSSKNRPRIYLQAGNFDPLRDDAVVFEKLLASKGYKTKIDVFPDDGHAAWSIFPMQSKSRDPEIVEATMAGMEWLLRGDRQW